MGEKTCPFEIAGAIQHFEVATAKVAEDYFGPRMTLGDVVIPEGDFPPEYFVSEGQLLRREYLKGIKCEPRVDKHTGYEYFYSEGRWPFQTC